MSMFHAQQAAFSPSIPFDYNDPLDWTTIQRWRVADGDMTAISTAFGGQSDGRRGVIWSLDGTVITLASSSSDSILSFSCSTPWDPDTATNITGRAVTNPGHLFASKDGSKIWVHRVGDQFVEIPAAAGLPWMVAGGAVPEDSNATKADFGFSGSSDMSIYPFDDFSGAIIDGPPTDYRRFDVTPDGNLDALTLDTLFDIAGKWTQNASIGGSKVSKDGLRIYRGAGSQGVEILEMSSPFNIASLTSIGNFDNDVEVGFRPETVWTNPEDTTEFWVTGNVGGLELARMAANH